uniref:Uncharacterized protein n=1 Tax=Strombidium inclinatum TaxID=197538 RepID=A0A7S3II61_9SPIT
MLHLDHTEHGRSISIGEVVNNDVDTVIDNTNSLRFQSARSLFNLRLASDVLSSRDVLLLLEFLALLDERHVVGVGVALLGSLLLDGGRHHLSLAGLVVDERLGDVDLFEAALVNAGQVEGQLGDIGLLFLLQEELLVEVSTGGLAEHLKHGFHGLLDLILEIHAVGVLQQDPFLMTHISMSQLLVFLACFFQ